MKIKNYLCGLLGLAAFAACQPAFVPELEVTPLEITVPGEGGDFTFTVKSNEDWTATTEADWFTLDLTSGKADQGSTPVKLSVNSVNYSDDKTATITIKSTSLSQTVNVTWTAKVQDGSEANPYYIFTAEELTLMRNKAESGKATYFVLGADIDMDGIDSYVPVNYGDEIVNGDSKTTTYDRQIHFDGANHTIKNFSCDWQSYPSLFGVLYGSCKNLTITGANITGTTACGILAGYAGTEVTVDGTTVAHAAVVTNVKVQGTVNGTAAGTGGMAGFARCATFTNCEVDVTVTSTNTDMGGFVGKAVGTAAKNVFAGCKVKAVVTSKAAEKNRVGGLIGWNSCAEVEITDCQILEGTVLNDESNRTKASNGNFGGLIGFGDTTGSKVKIANCSVNVSVLASDFATYNAFLVGGNGYASSTTVENCKVKGTLTGGNYTSGLFGAVQGDLTVKNTGVDGNITTKGQRCGGLFGSIVTKDHYTSPVKATNCYYNGNISGTGQQIGGLVGYTNHAIEITNCYATGDVTSTTSGAAGLVGAIDVTGSIVTKSIAWNKNINCPRTGNDSWAPGGVIGAARYAGTYSQCIRRADMVLVDGANAMVLVDQNDYVNAFPAAPYKPAKNEYAQQAYHGKAAASGKTASAVAKDLAWDTAVWDLSGDLPKLK